MQKGEKTAIARDYLTRFPTHTVAELRQRVQKERGIDIPGHAFYGLKSRQRDKEFLASPTPAKGFKSSLVREFIAKYPELGYKDIKKKIKKERGVDVSESIVSNVLTAISRKLPQETNHVSTNGQLPPAVDNLTKVYSLVNEIGSIEEAQTLLDTLKSLQVKGNG